LIYVATTTQVVSAAIVVERREEGHALLVQRPVYFISEVLSETKICYPQIQKLLYAVRARLAQLQLLILSEDLEELCQTGIFLNWFSYGAERLGVVFVKKGGI
jgi:hypothetical protein